MTPQRIQRRRTKGWRMPPDTIIVDRRTIWGNPFNSGDRAADVAAYERGVSTWPVPHENLATWQEAGGSTAMLFVLASRLAVVLYPLHGMNLACWCRPADPCHADVLLRIVREAFEVTT